MLSVRNLNKTFGEFALKGLSFDVAEGEYFVLLGPSGVGKTVLLETIAGMHCPDSGRIVLSGRDITNEKIQRRGVALVYQAPALFPHMTVRRNVAYGLRSAGLARRAIDERIEELVADVGIDGLLDRRPTALSGGQAQRVALARALATRPRCLLLDEPIAALDIRSRRMLRSLLRSLNRRGHTMLHVTHDFEEAVSLASTVAIMDGGRIVQIGAPADVFGHPKSEFVANLIGIRNFFSGRLQRPDSAGGPAELVTSGLVFRVQTDEKVGPGCLLLRGEDVIVSRAQPETSAQNTFEGVIVDIAPERSGVAVVVDVGVEISALLSMPFVEGLSLACGQKAWVSFEASAARFLRD